MSQSLEDKMFMFFQAIDSIQTGNDGSIHVKWKNNVVQEVPGNSLKMIQGVDVVQANEIHLNPEAELYASEIDELQDILIKEI